MKSHAPRVAVAGAALFLAVAAAPALARDFVQDQAGMFSASTVAQLNERLAAFNAQTRKEVVVVTVPSLGGAALQQAAQTTFGQQSVNGVLIFIARDDRRDIIVPDRAGVQAGWFTPDVLRSIRASMEAQFRAEDYDAGITNAVDGILGIYRSHLGSLQSAQSNQSGSTAIVPVSNSPANRGVHISMFWWIIIAIVGFLLLRSILRAASAPRYSGAPGGPGTSAPSGPGYGPGYGYGGYGGGGSFWSGLLGGLGGAWLGNELFRGGGGMPGAGTPAGGDAGGSWGGADGGGWQSDAGQADLGGASGGDFSGGGFGGDAGGDFGGGDFGGGDGGGGW